VHLKQTERRGVTSMEVPGGSVVKAEKCVERRIDVPVLQHIEPLNLGHLANEKPGQVEPVSPVVQESLGVEPAHSLNFAELTRSNTLFHLAVRGGKPPDVVDRQW